VIHWQLKNLLHHSSFKLLQ